MFGNLGYAEVIIICFLALLLFGAKRLPEIGSSLGKSIRMFKKSVKDLQDELPNKDDMYGDEDDERYNRPRPQQQKGQQQDTQKQNASYAQDTGKTSGEED